VRVRARRRRESNLDWLLSGSARFLERLGVDRDLESARVNVELAAAAVLCHHLPRERRSAISRGPNKAALMLSLSLSFSNTSH